MDLNSIIERLHTAQKGHYLEYERYKRINYCIELPLVILSSSVSSFIFFSSDNKAVSIILKGAGLMVAILTSLNMTVDAGTKAETHRIKASKYGTLKRKAELLNVDSSFKSDKINELFAEWNSIAEDSPVTSKKIVDKVSKISKDI